MTLHAERCCYSPFTTPLSILDDLGVVWFAALPATGRSEKPGRVRPPPYADRWADFGWSLCATISVSGEILCILDSPFCAFCKPISSALRKTFVPAGPGPLFSPCS
jgi:hypothetical protein